MNTTPITWANVSDRLHIGAAGEWRFKITEHWSGAWLDGERNQEAMLPIKASTLLQAMAFAEELLAGSRQFFPALTTTP